MPIKKKTHVYLLGCERGDKHRHHKKDLQLTLIKTKKLIIFLNCVIN